MRAVALKYLCTTITRGSAPAYSSVDSGSALAIGQSCVRPDGSIDTTRARWHDGPVPSKGRLHGGEVLVNSTGTGTIGRVGWLRESFDHPVFVDGHVTILRANPRVAEGRFLAYSLGLPATRQYIEDALSVGATKQRELNVESLRAHPIVVLPRSEQTVIANFLDRECARIDDALIEVQRLRALLTEVEQRRLDEIVPWSAPQPRLGWLADVRTGVTIGQRYPAGTPLVSRPYLRVANVQADHLDLTEIKTVDVPANDAASTTLEDGDVLMTEGGDIDKLGRGTVWRGEIPNCLHQNHVFAVRPYDDRLSSRYLAAITRTSHARRYFESTATRSTNLASTNSTKVRSFRFPVPPRSSQLEIVRTVERHLASTMALRSDLHLLQRGLAEYRDALITEAVTGKLDVTKLSESRMDESLAAVRDGERPEVLPS